LGIGIELADQSIPVIFRGGRELGDEGFNKIATGFFERLGPAEIGGISLHEGGIEIMLTDQKTEFVPEPGLAVA
jgi:hypothetical protein